MDIGISCDIESLDSGPARQDLPSDKQPGVLEPADEGLVMCDRWSCYGIFLVLYV